MRHVVGIKREAVAEGLSASEISRLLWPPPAPQRGAAGVAGDVGHIAVSRAAGIRCRCGKAACLEAIAGAPAVAAQLRKNGLEATTGNDVVSLVRAGDLAAIQAVRQAGRDIGEMLNMCVSFINPSLVVIGGSLAQSGEHLIAGIRETVYALLNPIGDPALEYHPIRNWAGSWSGWGQHLGRRAFPRPSPSQ